MARWMLCMVTLIKALDATKHNVNTQFTSSCCTMLKQNLSSNRDMPIGNFDLNLNNFQQKHIYELKGGHWDII